MLVQCAQAVPCEPEGQTGSVPGPVVLMRILICLPCVKVVRMVLEFDHCLPTSLRGGGSSTGSWRYARWVVAVVQQGGRLSTWDGPNPGNDAAQNRNAGCVRGTTAGSMVPVSGTG
jgi:hypothetical protein